MFQVFIFYSYAISGQDACAHASEKVNRFLQKYEVVNPQITTNFTSSYSHELGCGTGECVVTVTGQVEVPITLTLEDTEDIVYENQYDENDIPSDDFPLSLEYDDNPYLPDASDIL